MKCARQEGVDVAKGLCYSRDSQGAQEKSVMIKGNKR
jgi:hypothetical protein